MNTMISPYAFVGMREVPKKDKPTISEIITYVCTYLNVKEDRIYERTRSRDVVFARHVIYGAIRNIHPITPLKKIGKMFGQDHTTIIHGLQVLQDYIDTNSDYAHEYKRILNLLK